MQEKPSKRYGKGEDVGKAGEDKQHGNRTYYLLPKTDCRPKARDFAAGDFNAGKKSGYCVRGKMFKNKKSLD